MDQKRSVHLRNILLTLLERVRTDAKSVEEKALGASGGQANGGLSNVPMHLADLATDTFMQELNETLLENERYVVSEISAALRRIEDGTFGLCDNCGAEILDARIEALPYTRHCVSCAEKIRPEPVLNLRPAGTQLKGSPGQDIHGTGTAGGGTALGGLAGTNQGHGDPSAVNLVQATASGEFDHLDSRDAEPTSGAEGGAAGGTPAGKRSDGTKPRRVKGLHRADRASPPRRRK